MMTPRELLVAATLFLVAPAGVQAQDVTLCLGIRPKVPVADIQGLRITDAAAIAKFPLSCDVDTLIVRRAGTAHMLVLAFQNGKLVTFGRIPLVLWDQLYGQEA